MMSKLFYVIGASGAGKDSLINYCRSQINGTTPVVFAHRYITRPASAHAENHVSLTEGEFLLRLELGLFALHWQSHGLYYGIGTEIDQWLQAGVSVVINGSREYLPAASEKYPNLQAILIEADDDVIKARLLKRGREDEEKINKRISRNQGFDIANNNIIRIQNNGLMHEAAEQLLNALLENKNADHLPEDTAGVPNAHI